MTFGASVAWSALRALVLALVGLWCCRLWSKWIDAAPPRRQRRRWLLICGPALVPELLLGMAYATTVAGRPWWAELALAALVGLRNLAAGLVVWRLTPAPALTPAAWHLRQMTWTTPPTWQEWLAYQRAGWVGQQLPTCVLLFLLAFQEFELAALFRAASWTDWLFVAQVGGLSLRHATWLAQGPMLGQLLLVCLVNWRFTSGVLREPQPLSHQDDRLARGLVLVAWVVLALIPLAGLVVTLPAGFMQLLGQSLRWKGLLRELLGGTTLALCAACCAWILVSLVNPKHRETQPYQAWASRVIRGLIIVPGLMGSLVLALLVLNLHQRDFLQELYDTPIPWCLAGLLFLLPRALVLQQWSAAVPSALIIAEQLAHSTPIEQRRVGHRLLWQLRDEPRFLAICCLTYWAYLEVTLAGLLAPTGLTAGVVRLYNFLHFGRTAALSAEMAILLGGPLVVAALVWSLLRRGRA